ncbi:MAG: chalcone isomerase family protein [Flavobacterium sp.]|nr:chalcone isomerase family protein [Flavobacterium sp.]
MKKIIFILLVALSQSFATQAQTQFEVEGVTVPRTINFEGSKLELNGFGVRSKAWVDVYVQALYLTILSQDPEFIMDSETPMGIRIEIISSLVSSKKLSKALYSGLEKSVGDEGMLKIEKEAKMLETIVNSEITKKGDVFHLIYNPTDVSIWIMKNDKLAGKIAGLDFKKAFLGIWLSNNPVDKDLKNDLLGIIK